MNHHSERVWSLGVGRGAVCVRVCGWVGSGVGGSLICRLTMALC